MRDGGESKAYAGIHAPVIMACSPLIAFHCFFLFPQQLKATSKRTPHARVVRTVNETAFHTRTQKLARKKAVHSRTNDTHTENAHSVTKAHDYTASLKYSGLRFKGKATKEYGTRKPHRSAVALRK